MKPVKLTEEARAKLLADLNLKRELTTKKLMARYGVGRTTLWKLEHDRQNVSCETKQNVQLTQQELNELVGELKRA